MIRITIDLEDATPAEAQAFLSSKTREFLLYETARDLAAAKLTIQVQPGIHQSVDVVDDDEVRLRIDQRLAEWR